MDIRHTITRFGATALIGCGLAVTAIPATFAQNGEESVTYVYSDKATSHISEVWYKGETLKITGEGFLTQDGTSGSTIAIKLNKGTVKIDGKDYLEVQADEKGNFSVSIPWQDDLEERISVDVYLLSGSLRDNDTARGGKTATVKIAARSVQEATPPLPHLRALRQPLLWWLPLRVCGAFRICYPLGFRDCFGYRR